MLYDLGVVDERQLTLLADSVVIRIGDTDILTIHSNADAFELELLK